MSATPSRPLAGSMTWPPLIRVNTARLRRGWQHRCDLGECGGDRNGLAWVLRHHGHQRPGCRSCSTASWSVPGWPTLIVNTRLLPKSRILSRERDHRHLACPGRRRRAVGGNPNGAVRLARFPPDARHRNARYRVRESRAQSSCAWGSRSSNRKPAARRAHCHAAASARPLKRRRGVQIRDHATEHLDRQRVEFRGRPDCDPEAGGTQFGSERIERSCRQQRSCRRAGRRRAHAMPRAEPASHLRLRPTNALSRDPQAWSGRPPGQSQRIRRGRFCVDLRHRRPHSRRSGSSGQHPRARADQSAGLGPQARLVRRREHHPGSRA